MKILFFLVLPVVIVLLAYVVVAVCDVIANIVHVESFRQGRD